MNERAERYASQISGCKMCSRGESTCVPKCVTYRDAKQFYGEAADEQRKVDSVELVGIARDVMHEMFKDILQESQMEAYIQSVEKKFKESVDET